MMSGYSLLFSLAVLVCKVNSQVYSPPILPPAPCLPIPCQPTPPPCPVACPQVINPNPCVTTIIDNSVSNALVNALQLLIVSNLIGATIGPSAPLLNNLGPLLDSLVCPNPCLVDVILPEYLCGTSYDFVSPYAPITSCGPYYDLIPSYSPVPTCAPYYNYIPPCGPITTCSPCYDLIPPCGSIYDPYPPPLCGLSDLYPNYITYTETLTPICIDSYPYNGYGDLLLPLPGIETFCPNYYNGLTEIIPNYINYPIPEICPLNPYYGGFVETVSTLPLPNMYGLNEVIAPCLPPLAPYVPELPFGPLTTVLPSCYGGLTELSLPCAADLMYPSTIPCPLACNYGYSPSSLPCVKVNMEPLAYDCLYNGYGGPIYY